jgi:putative membrane protein
VAQPDPDPEDVDVSRRTWLAAERTWLAWWRSGIAVGAVALAVGRLVPDITHGARWPFRALGVAYGLLSIAILIVGGLRQRQASSALRRGSFAELGTTLVDWLTGGAIALSVVVTVLVLIVI